MAKSRKKETVEYSEDIEEVEAVKADTESSEINDDGLVKGAILDEKDYWALMNKQRAKK